MKFIEKYIKFASPLTEAPSIYHGYMAYMLMSQAIGKNVYYTGAGSLPLSPNFWMVIIGPSSMAKKSTTLRIGLNHILDNVYGDDSYLYPAEGSYESFVELLSEQPQGLLAHSEWASFMAWCNRDYNSAVAPLLTDLYDQPPVRTRRVGTREKKKLYVIRNPYINIIACSTMEWFNENLTSSKMIGGFMPRFILIPTNASSLPIHETPDPDRSLQMELIEELNRYRNIGWVGKDNERHLEPVKLAYDKAALEKHRENYFAGKKMLAKCNELIVPFHSRRITDLNKFAMIHCLMRDSRVMNSEDFDHGKNITDQLIEYNESLINDKLALTRYEKTRQRVLGHIIHLASLNSGEWIDLSLIMRSCRMQRRELLDTLENLKDENTIIQAKPERSTNGKSKTSYKLNQNMEE